MRQLLKAIGLTEQSYYRMVRENSIKLQTLHKILEFLRMNESDFFSSDFAELIHGTGAKPMVKDPVVSYMAKDTRTALIEKDLQIMETLIKSIRHTLNH